MQGEAIYNYTRHLGWIQGQVSIHHVALGKARVGRPKSMRAEEFAFYQAQVLGYVYGEADQRNYCGNDSSHLLWVLVKFSSVNTQ